MAGPNTPLQGERISGASPARVSIVVLGMPFSGVSALAGALERSGAQVVAWEGLQALREGFEQIDSSSMFIHVVRDPAEVARALQEARGFQAAEGLALWEAYCTAALRALEGYSQVLVTHDQLVANPGECVEGLLQKLAGLGVEPPRTLRQINPEAEFVRSHEQLWRLLASGRLDEVVEHKKQVRDRQERTLHNRTAQLATLRSRTKEQASEIDILNQRVAWLDAQVMELQASSSWRITAPLRSLSTTAKRIRGLFSGKQAGGQALSARTRGDVESVPARPPAVLEGEDTFVLYRIIGNDLYPRHKRDQAIENLQFILQHEPTFDRCEKRFVVNRILDAGQEREIISLLEQAGFEYLHLPFDAREYARIGFDTGILPEPDFLSGEGFESLGDAGKGRLFAALYRHKNNYVMNNNGARNAALQDGRGRAKWILPWDGNCFLTRGAWDAIRQDIARAPENRYFVVPMVRIPDNNVLVSGGELPRAVEEPQIVFRVDAEEVFNAEFCYGRRPKVELLWRLGVNGPWDDYPDDPWDQARAPVSSEAAATARAGWVARLSSGMTTLEADSDQAPLHRGLARSGAILATLQHLDARLAGAEPEQPVTIRMPVLRREAESRHVPPLSDAVDALRRAAEVAMSGGQAGLQRVIDDSVVLALAWSFTGVKRYVERGVEILASGFVNLESQEAWSPASDDLPGIAGLHYYLDAVRIFESAGSVGEATGNGFRAWLEARLLWLSTAPGGLSQRGAGDHRGTCHDLQVASIAAFLDDHERVYASLVRAQARMDGQFAPDGSQPGEAVGPGMAHGCCLNVQYWTALAELGSRWGVDLWGHRTADGSGLGQGARWLLAGMGGLLGGGNEGFDVQRLLPIWFAANERVDGLPCPEGQVDSVYTVKPRFAPEAGIRPFWNLASHGGRAAPPPTKG